MDRIQEQNIIQKAGEESLKLNKNTCSIYVAEADLEEFKEAIAANCYIYIISHKICRNQPEFILQILGVCKSYTGNAVILHSSEPSSDIIEKADKCRIPLYVCPEQIRVSTMLQDVYEWIRSSSDNEEKLELLFQSVINRTFDSQGKVIFTAQQYGIDLETKSSALILYNHEDLNADQFAGLYMIVKDQVQKLLSRKILMSSSGNEIVLIVPYDDIAIDQLLDMITAEAKKTGLELNLFAGVGMPTRFVDKISDSYFQARRACRLQRVMDKKDRIQYFSKLGLYNLLFYVKDKNELRRFYTNMLGRLEEYDQLNDANLTETLSVYLENNCNSQMTAAALYIHRNTLRYRLERISTIIQEDLDDRLIDAEFIMAFMIKKYLKSIETLDIDE